MTVSHHLPRVMLLAVAPDLVQVLRFESTMLAKVLVSLVITIEATKSCPLLSTICTAAEVPPIVTTSSCEGNTAVRV